MARYVKDDQIIGIYELRDMYKNASIPDGGDASIFGWELLIETPRPILEYGYIISEGPPVNNTQTWITEQMPDDSMAKIVKANRDQLLTESDWTQISDAPVNKEVWMIYRQALRDITIQAGFPWIVEWPISPALLIDTPPN